MSAGAVVWGLYGLATVVAVVAFLLYARRRGFSFDVIDGIIVALLWPLFVIVGILGKEDAGDDF